MFLHSKYKNKILTPLKIEFISKTNLYFSHETVNHSKRVCKNRYPLLSESPFIRQSTSEVWRVNSAISKQLETSGVYFLIILSMYCFTILVRMMWNQYKCIYFLKLSKVTKTLTVSRGFRGISKNNAKSTRARPLCEMIVMASLWAAAARPGWE